MTDLKTDKTEKFLISASQPRTSRTSTSSRDITIALGVVLALSLTACGGEQTAKAAEKPAAETTTAVDTTTPVNAVLTSSGALGTTRSVGATLTAATDSNVAAEASGRAIQVLRREGELVKANEIIVQLDSASAAEQVKNAQLAVQTASINLETAQRQKPETLAQAKRSLEAANASLEAAARTFKANKRIYEEGGLSRVEFSNTQASLSRAQAEERGARDAVSRAERAGSENLALLQVALEQSQASLEQAGRQLRLTSIKAPFAGRIVEVVPNVGEFVNAGTKVFRLVDTSSLRAKFNVPSNEAAKLPVGTSLRVVTSGKKFDARVASSANAPGQNRLVALQARFVSGQALENLGVGALVQVRYDLKLAKGALVPSGAVGSENGQAFVWAIKGDKLKRANVTVLAESNGRIALGGIPGGVQVVYPVPSGLQPGGTVKVLGGKR
jgi:HlyD family secretion protein